jgi:hypothetical protein
MVLLKARLLCAVEGKFAEVEYGMQGAIGGSNSRRWKITYVEKVLLGLMLKVILLLLRYEVNEFGLG